MGAVIADVYSQRMDRRDAQTVIAATGKMLKNAEMAHRYGKGKATQLRLG